jgi:diaminohydroxyphosphoribosylaminopyrimidine deaminase/5-amino-6-(5-phosphoribosylamino)uracil reductase
MTAPHAAGSSGAADPDGRFSAADRAHMAAALALAERGMYTTTPNPRVGCVIVNGDAVIGEGFHLRAGEPHAEVNALADAKAKGHDPRGAALYVTLEPCSTHGRTPPCVDAILAAGIAKVFAALPDPNPAQANGAGRLRAAGVDVVFGPGTAQAHEQNIGFVARMQRGRPWVRMKIAASLDGRTALASGQSQWITGPAARADGHRWRARACAILTGIGTVTQDDPQLTARDVVTPRQPLRVVVDRHGQTPVAARVLADANALVVTAGERNPAWPDGLSVLALPDADRRVDLPALLRALAERGINEVHVEAGAKLNGALLEAGLVDELLLYLAPTVLGDPARGMFERAVPLAQLAAGTRLVWHRIDRVGDDVRIVARTAAPQE